MQRYTKNAEIQIGCANGHDLYFLSTYSKGAATT